MNPKMVTNNSNHASKTLQVKQEEKVSFSKRLTRNVSMGNSIKEDNYHGGTSVAVPFTWESQPGTPKIQFRENPLPPLTPPPSYFYSTPRRSSTKKPSKHNLLLDTIFPVRATRRRSLSVSPAFSSSSSSSSSSYSSQPSSPWLGSNSMPSTPRMVSSKHRVSSPRKSFESRLNVDDQDERDCDSPVSTLCFGISNGANARTGSSCFAAISKILHI